MPDFHHFIRPTTDKPPSLVSVTVISALIGLATGAAGFSLMRSLYPSELAISGNWDLNNTKIKLDEPLTMVGAQLDGHLAAVYNHLEPTGSIYNQLYSDRDYLGTGVVVTSDGWVIVPQTMSLSSNVDIIINNKIYVVKQQSLDAIMGIRFLKIDANDLSPIQFVRDNNLSSGSTLVYEQARLVSGPLLNRVLVQQANVVDSTSKLSQVHGATIVDAWHLVDADQSISTFYFDLSGVLVGMGSNGKLIPGYFLNASVDKFLAKTAYVNLGVSYIDIYRLPNHQNDKGVLIYHPQKAAVVAGSPAQKAGIIVNDIIAAVNGVSIDKSNSLGKLLVGFKSGDTVKLTIVRNQKSQEISVQF